MAVALYFGHLMSNVAAGILQVQGRLRREIPIDTLPEPPDRQSQGAFLARMYLSVLAPLVRWRLVRRRLVSPYDNVPDGMMKLLEDQGEPPLPRSLQDRVLARWWDRNAVTFLAIPLLAVLLAVTVGRLTGHWHYWLADAIAAGGTGAIAFYVIDSVLSFARQGAGKVIRPYLLLHPQDELLLDLLTAASLSSRYRAIWFRSVTSRDICQCLEQAACRAERPSRLKARALPQDRPTRSAMRQDGAKIAAVLRAHKQAIARANGPGKYQQVCESLCSGILALANDDWTTLTASAPATVHRPRLLRLAGRAAPAIALATAGLAIPMLPALHILPTTASNTRITLLAAAVLSLLPVSSSAADKITSAL